jgi:hypothetical protein
MATPFHTCSCGATYTKAQWVALPAPRKGEFFEDEFERLQFKNCPCGSTRAVVVEQKKPPPTEGLGAAVLQICRRYR